MSNQPLNPNITRNIIIAVLVVVMILGSFTGLWLILNPTEPTFAFAEIPGFKVASVVFGGMSSNASNYINMTIQNTGGMPWTLNNTAQVNSVTGLALISTYGLICAQNYSITIKIANVNWTSGNQYWITLLLYDGYGNGNRIIYGPTATPGGHSSDPNPNPKNIPLIPSPSLIAILGPNAPLIVAFLAEIAVLVAGLGVMIYIRKHSQRALKLYGGFRFAVLETLMIYVIATITFCLVYSYLAPSLTFSWILARAPR